MNVLALNAGSSSLKFGLFDGAVEPLVGGDVDWADGNRQKARLTVRARQGSAESSPLAAPDDATAVAIALRSVAKRLDGGVNAIGAVGHRVVHGGAAFQHSIRIDPLVKSTLQRLSALAPLHNPPALRVIEAAEAALPGVTQAAVFDTAFYADLPPKAYVYPLPYRWHLDWGLRRFGFHGLSHAYCAHRAADLLAARGTTANRIVICHLGGGCSATAVRQGKAVATTMGFSPLEGLMMGTRCGSVDPGLLLHVQREMGLSLQALDHALNHESGLLGVSGLSPDLAQIEAAAAQGHDRARLAFDMLADRVRSAIGALSTSLGGIDALVFTDRIGESSAALRAAACDGLAFMGIRLDAPRNAQARADCDIAADDSPARILVLHTREEWVVARETARVAG